ncbi:MAG: hypothetical protein IJT30_09970 [Muribaculaceae bacterium]|nr:hypothetical protein [Muribaculaceae bacterium]
MNTGLPPNFVNGGRFIAAHFVTRLTAGLGGDGIAAYGQSAVQEVLQAKSKVSYQQQEVSEQ